MAAFSCNMLCKRNRTAFVLTEAFSAPWKAAPQPTVTGICSSVCVPPHQLRCPGFTSGTDVSVVPEEGAPRPSWAPGTGLAVPAPADQPLPAVPQRQDPSLSLAAEGLLVCSCLRFGGKSF